MTKVTFLHAADLHLDSPFKGLGNLPEAIFTRLKLSTFTSLKNIINLALLHEVDFVLLAGDLYDQEDRSIKAQNTLRKEFERLHKANIPVYLIHGNHDHTGGNWIKLHWPDNVHFFSDKEVERKPFRKNGQVLANIYGFSYPHRAVYEKMIHHYQKGEDGIYHIGLLHGNVEGGSEHSPYAPFKLTELLEKDFDYWALGHIHKRQVLSKQPPIIYPGNIQGRHKKETGEKGCYIVTLTKSDAHYHFFNTADIIWESVQISIQHLQTIDELYTNCLDLMNQLRLEQAGLFLTITLTGSGVINELLTEQVIEELQLMMNEDEAQKYNFVWVTSILNDTQQAYDREQLKSESTFLGELLSTIDCYEEYEQALSSILSHPQVRKYIENFDEKELKAIKEEAENLLLQSLLHDYK